MNASTEHQQTHNSIRSAASSSDEILNSVRQLLKNQIFSGRYEERRLIEIGSVSAYKDIIIVDKSEQEFMRALKAVNDTLINHFHKNIITCISDTQSIYGTPSSYSIWTNLNRVTLGGHWFQIKNVAISDNVFHISLKSLRSLRTSPEESASVDLSQFFSNINSDAFKKWLIRFFEYITLDNIVTFSRFLVVLFLTLLIGCYHLLELLLRGVKEMNSFVHNISPVLIACVDGITKIFGGFFILIAMMWNSWYRKGAPYYPPPPAYLRSKPKPFTPRLVNYPMPDKCQPLDMQFQRK